MTKSKWGFHPCDFETYAMLKSLSKWYHDALHRRGTHHRWDRKQPQNRLGGEPPWSSEDAKLVKEYEKADVLREYRNARSPAPSEAEVKPMRVTVSALAKMLESIPIHV